MRFGEYLVSRGKIGEKEMLEAVAQQRSYHKVIGQLAIEMNMLGPRDVARIRGIQRSEGKKFGEIAINLNLLTPEQVDALLKIQKADHQFLGKVLVTQGRMTPEELVAELRKFSAIQKVEGEQRLKCILVASANTLTRQKAVEDFDPSKYRLIEAHNGEKTIEMFRLHKPQLIVLDRELPDSGGYEVCRMLREEPDSRFIPAIILARSAEEIDSALGLQVGATDYLLYPFSKGSLERFVQKLLELHETKKEHLVLVVDDNPMTRHSLKYQLLREGFDVVDLETSDDVLHTVTSGVDCVVFALETSIERGLQVAREVRQQHIADYVPMIFIATEESRQEVMPLLGSGMNDIVVRPFEQEELAVRLRCHASYKKLIDRLDLQRELLQIQKAELEESNQKALQMVKQWKLAYLGYRRVLESISEILMVIDTGYKIQAANPAALKALGVAKERDAIGMTCHRLLTGTDRVCDDCAARRVLETGKEAHCVRPWKMPEGGIKALEESAFPILNSKGQVVRIVVHAHPVDRGSVADG
jgi:DNA-binding response OmpR family regulator